VSDEVKIGYVVRAHGVRGGLRVRCDGDAILALERVLVDGREYVIEHVQPERGEFLLQLGGVRDRDAAEALRGRTLAAHRAQLPPPAEDELYVADLVGCEVLDGAGARLGEVKDTFHSGAHEILLVSDGAREFMLPFVAPIVTAVDVGARRIVCDPPEGLIDLEPS
jgi:16S rRNA processing protein RimM